MTRPARAVIDLKALRANLQRVRAAAPLARVLAVIKANAYGHGLVRVAEALHESVAREVEILVDIFETFGRNRLNSD